MDYRNAVLLAYRQETDFFAWYPYNSKNLTIPKDNNVKDTKLFYEIPEQVADQEDFMMANSYEVSETSSVPIFSDICSRR